MNKNRLLGVIKSAGDTQQDLADALDQALNTVNSKINGRVEFSRADLQTIKEKYSLSPEEMDIIFFQN